MLKFTAWILRRAAKKSLLGASSRLTTTKVRFKELPPIMYAFYRIISLVN